MSWESYDQATNKWELMVEEDPIDKSVVKIMMYHVGHVVPHKISKNKLVALNFDDLEGDQRLSSAEQSVLKAALQASGVI